MKVYLCIFITKFFFDTKNRLYQMNKPFDTAVS